MTIVIVGVALVMLVEGLNKSKFEAAHTRNLKVARELALMTLGEIAGGEWREEIEDGLDEQTYADQGYPLFHWEVLVGDEQFPELEDVESNLPYDAIEARREREREQLEDSDGDEELLEEPYEQVRIRVTFPTTGRYKGELMLEQWIEWELVYGKPEEGGGAR
ncbi:hypothetical protein Pla86_22690 [Planctomycetes bacterium Pla86]|uniref:Uncharacterized protein n=1 Tax=Engelhardtia mirabilis TaxID=2528011 RepID=A0A518BJM8_9BACT|nr:hypothetical protein Pla133_22690 [Planctomycetes bacterium Pla133]QDV01518.1 hypothetical protein Pla86_22690 [Planctomycetes bacterium Pla86]